MATDKTDPRKPTGLRGVFLKQETPPGLWSYLAKTIGLWLLGIAFVVWLLIGLAALAGDEEPGLALGLAIIYAVLFLVVRKIPTRKPEDFLPEGYLEEYQERKREDRDR
ncbi:MAG: hypothetical protein OXJ54_17115 [Gemmatimonadetes bacterium]|nr:hypothetical protein [Candidatus Palauibacter rhopaloidicola]